MAQTIEESVCNAGNLGLIPGLIRSSGGGHIKPPPPIFLPGESLWTKEPGQLQSVDSQRVRHNWGTKDTYIEVCIFSISINFISIKWLSYLFY